MATSMGRKRRRGVAVLGAVAALTIYLVGAAVPASAAQTCVVSGTAPSQTLTVTLSGADTTTLAVTATNITVTPVTGVPGLT